MHVALQDQLKTIEVSALICCASKRVFATHHRVSSDPIFLYFPYIFKILLYFLYLPKISYISSQNML
jgi:hypothetical protein